MALLTDYILTVAVSVAAGTAALASAVPALARVRGADLDRFIALIAAGNLRGVKESGKVFAVPTYFFIAQHGAAARGRALSEAVSRRPRRSTPLDHEGLVELGLGGDGSSYGASLFVVLHAFASGGAAVTGVEAISNGVPAFKEPAWRNARTTLVIMGVALGVMFLGLSVLAAEGARRALRGGHADGDLSQIGELVYGDRPARPGRCFFALQVGTMLILVLAANTSFADFPRLASFQASDNFMPRQLTKRGHRLVFSNGIIALAWRRSSCCRHRGQGRAPDPASTPSACSPASPSRRRAWPSTTCDPPGAGLEVRARHQRRRGRPSRCVVLVIFAVTKFTHGAWVIIVLIPWWSPCCSG